MTAFSYTVVHESGAVTSGTDYTGHFTTPEALGDWYRGRTPNAVEVRVWAGEQSDQPAAARPLSGAVA